MDDTREDDAELTPAQLEIMDVVWQQGEVTVADVLARLQAERPLARNTVQTMLTRLADRGWLNRRTVGNAHTFSAARPRERVVAGMARRLMDTAFKGSASGLVAALLDDHAVSREEAARIRAMLDEAQRRRRR